MPHNNIHAHYDCLTTIERDFVDACFAEIFHDAKLQKIPLIGTDPAERAVDALARLIMESRPKPPSRFKPPIRIAKPTMTETEKAWDRIGVSMPDTLAIERTAFDKWAANVRP